MSRILLVEDEPAIAEAVAYALGDAGHEVDAVGTGDAGLAAARARQYDLMILDLMLPGVPGIEVCRTLRAESDLPIVMLTALDAEGDRVLGLDSGADDYVTKPFAIAELVGRVHALLRRRRLNQSGLPVRVVGDLRVDVARLSATLASQPLRLTRSEFRLLSVLASDPGRPFSREELRAALGLEAADERSIDVHVSNLRRKLEANPRRPRRLLTVRGAGYTLVE